MAAGDKMQRKYMKRCRTSWPNCLTSIRMLRVRTSVRSTMPIHVATVVTSSAAASSSSAASRAGPARPREEPAPAAVGVVLVPEAAHEAAHAAAPAANAEHGGARGRVRRRQPPGDAAHRDQNNAHTCRGQK